MLFNSYDFLFLFLPACLLVTYAAARLGGLTAGKIALIVMSLAFYAYWRVDHLWIILASISVNYAGVRLATRLASLGLRNLGLATLVSFNVILIGAFKYFNLILTTYHDLTNVAIDLAAVALPLGISFFSFQQIAYVVDFHRGGRRDDSFIDYSLAVLFFPHLIAGPLVKYRSLIDQFNAAPAGEGAPTSPFARLFRPTAVGIAIGVTILAIGLCKKVFFADNFAVYADPVFSAAEQGVALSLQDAWIGAVSFFFQIYFDFSGYTDMAIGLALLFGITLPVNFLSPYMSRSIIEFWRRWHITLSSFLRDYVYIALLGGNRRGPALRYFNLLLTMLIGGLWHGASWTFVAWGGLHGLFLVINHMYNRVRAAVPFKSSLLERLFYQLLTVFAVLLTWVYFRAETFEGAHRIFAAMFDINAVAATMMTYETMASTLPGQFARAFIELDMPTFGMTTTFAAIAASAALLVFLFPNTYELFSLHHEAESEVPPSLRVKPLINVRWTLSPHWMLFAALVLALGLLSMTQVAQFIYFEF